MSGIVLSASVRQNLLSLQSTAALLATTQNDLSTGNKVNSALDNPTEFFTAQDLNSRASDINNLLDGIGNGVQVLQAANTGITSLQSLIANAQSIANQVLQTTSGYTTKSSVTTAAISGATANNLLGTASAFTNAAATAGTALTDSDSGTTVTNASFLTATFTNAAATAGTPLTDSDTADTVTGATALTGTSTTDGLSGTIANGDTILVNGKTITFSTSAATSTNANGGTINITSGTVANVLTAIDQITGTATASSVVGGAIQLQTGTTSNLSITDGTGTALAALGLGTGVTQARTASDAISGTIANGDNLVVNGKTITFSTSGATSTNASGGTINLTTGTVGNVLSAIDAITGTATASTVAGGAIQLQTGTTSDLTVTGTALSALGLGTGVTQARGGGTTPLASGQTLTIAATGGGTATSITFGTTGSDVSTLNQLNAALAANNLEASINTSGAITITTSNNAASSTVGALSGTAVTTAGAAFNGLTVAAPVEDAQSQSTRATLVNQYNEVLQQINTTAADSSFNGINLLNGDTLNLTFDETGASKLAINGVTFNDAGLGLSTLTAGTDFLDSNSANTVLASLSQASTTLSTEGSTLGSNLSIVEIRQDFNKNLINVLQTGASNLTLADPNQEAANSQALSTRQSIAVSALALANQSQQSVLQLLR
jgi:flagellin